MNILLELLNLSEAKHIQWIHPNLVDEFNEVAYQPEIKSYFKNKKLWLDAAKSGKKIELTKSQVNKLENHTPSKIDWKDLEDIKRERVELLFKQGRVEMPIVLADTKHDLMYLLAGNTRLNYANNNGYERIVWMIQTPDLENYL